MTQPTTPFYSSISYINQGGDHALPREYEKEGVIANEEKEDLLEFWREIYSSLSRNEIPPPTVSDRIISDKVQFGNANFLVGPIQDPEDEKNLQPRTSTLDEIQKLHHISDLDSLDLLKNYTSGFTKSKKENDQNNQENENLQTEEIIRIGADRYIQYTNQGVDHNLMFMHPYHSSLSSLSADKLRDVDLIHFLLAAAEKVGYKQFERASTLLARCDQLASDTGNPVQRVVYYCAQALRQRILKENGKELRNRIEEKEKHEMPHMATSTNLVFLKFHQEIPFNQLTLLTGVQSILEKVEKETKIHLIDFNIRSGVQWTSFMQTLANRVSHTVKYLKITAVALTSTKKIKETGKYLEAFAKSVNLNFRYRAIFLSDMSDLRRDHIQSKRSEAVVIYCSVILRTMISRPDSLENVMRVIKKLNPSMVVVTEVEANLNSPSFFSRFIDTLLYYSAYFDCLEDCTDRENNYRNTLERVFFGDGIHNIVADEGENRFTRSVDMNVWGTFFQKFGMVQLEISERSMYQAKLLLEKFACAKSCTLEKRGECLIVGWKGTPIQSLSTWAFL